MYKKSVVLIVAVVSLLAYSSVYSQDGTSVTCKAKIGSVVHTLSPNEDGEFPQIRDIATLATVNVEVTFSNAKGGKISVSVEDGGTLGNGKSVQSVTLNSTGKGSFTIKIGDQKGIYQVSIRKGAESYLMSFWAK